LAGNVTEHALLVATTVVAVGATQTHVPAD